MDSPLAGARYLLRGLALISRPGIRRFVVVPLAVNVVVFAAATWWLADRAWELARAWLPAWLDWLAFLLVPVVVLAVLVAAFFAFGLLCNLLAAPFNGLLAEAVERYLRGDRRDAPFELRKLLADLARSLVSELRKLVYVAVRMVPLLLLLWVPVVGAALWILFGAWMLAVSFLDYPMGNHGLGFPEQRRRLGERRMLSLGFGLAVMVGLSIPLFNLLVVPAAVAGATALWVERLEASNPPSPLSVLRG